MAVAHVGDAGAALGEEVAAAGEAVLNHEPLDADRADRERLGGVELDLGTEEPVRAALPADVREDPVHLLDRLLHRVAGHRLADDAVGQPAVERITRLARHLLAVQRVEAAEIVEPGHVVHVRVGEDDRVDLGDPQLHAREPKLGRGVDEERRAVRRRDVRTATPAPVARIRGSADGAAAADLRHPDARPGS